MSGRKKILVMIDWYLPGFKGGGPITSIANLVQGLSDHYDFDIVTSDRDHGDKSPYPDIELDAWHQLAPHCRVWYCSREGRSYRHFRKIIAETQYDLLYLNSMFSLRYTIFPLWNSRSAKPEVPVLLAPRGMLHAGALGLKSRKKKLFLAMLKATGIQKHLLFQATDEQEIEDIKGVFGPDAAIVLAGNLPKILPTQFETIEKLPGKLKLLFLSRLSEKKGLHILLDSLKTQTSDILVEIVGPDEEPGYWEKCAAIIAQLPPNIQVQKQAAIPPQDIEAKLKASHLFAMPTYGENFGHAIFEAMAVGRPVLISDQTPWLQLAQHHAGWDFPLSKPEAFSLTIKQVAEMDQSTWEKWAVGARQFALDFQTGSGQLEANQTLFDTALSRAISQQG